MTGEDIMDHCTNVLIADSAEEFCTALSASLQRAGGFGVCGTASDGEQAIRMIMEKKPGIRPNLGITTASPKRAPHFVPPI